MVADKVQPLFEIISLIENMTSYDLKKTSSIMQLNLNTAAIVLTETKRVDHRPLSDPYTAFLLIKELISKQSVGLWYNECFRAKIHFWSSATLWTIQTSQAINDRCVPRVKTKHEEEVQLLCTIYLEQREQVQYNSQFFLIKAEYFSVCHCF